MVNIKLFVFLLIVCPIFSNAQSIYLFKNEKGEEIVGVPKLRYRIIRENILLCDSAMEAHNNLMFQYDSILTVFRKKIELRDTRIEEQELTITQLNKNFIDNNISHKKEIKRIKINSTVKGVIIGTGAVVIIKGIFEIVKLIKANDY